MKTKSIFKYFIGSWKITRNLGTEGIAEGVATFTLRESSVIKYREDVHIKFNNSENLYEAYKEYLYKYDDKTQVISKYFMDNNKFYDLDFINGNKANGTHLCIKDNYKATYNLLSNDHFALEYQVLGPNKNYSIYTEFTKIQNDLETRLIGNINEETL